MKKIYSSALMAVLAFLCALNYCIFVFPNSFAPAGIDGICTMIQHVLHINMGYLSLLVNVPLLIAAFLVLNRDFAVKSAVFTLSFSLSMILLGYIDLSGFVYSSAISPVLAPVAAGVVRGILYAITLKYNGSAGGIDIISALIKHKNPHLNFMNILLGINTFIALCAYPVYGRTLDPVICSIVYAFVTSAMCNKLRNAQSETVQFEIFTQDPQSLCADIRNKLHLRATIIHANGASGQTTEVILCVVNKQSAPYLEELILRHPGCTVFKNTVSNSLAGVAYK